MLFSGGFVLVSLLVPPMPWAAIVACFISVIALLGRIPLARWAKFLSAPVAFLSMSSVTFLFTIDPGFRLSWAPDGWQIAAKLFLRSLAAVSALGFLSLSTPIGDILAVLQRMGVPHPLTELAALIYRFLSITVRTLQEMRTAQSWRMGRDGRKERLGAISMLASSLFVRCISRARRLEAGLEARGYTGAVHILPFHKPASPIVLGAIVATQVGVLMAAALSRVGGPWGLR